MKRCISLGTGVSLGQADLLEELYFPAVLTILVFVANQLAFRSVLKTGTLMTSARKGSEVLPHSGLRLK